jgi:hypothetical protein
MFIVDPDAVVIVPEPKDEPAMLKFVPLPKVIDDEIVGLPVMVIPPVPADVKVPVNVGDEVINSVPLPDVFIL